MKSILLTLLALSMPIASTLQSAEIIPVWNKTATSGEIFDIEFMPSGEEFILTSTTGEIQIRSSLDGELRKEHIDTTNLFINGYFEFTTDSNRIVIARSGLIQLVNLENFERLNYFAFGKDSVIKGFGDVVLDPIRPYAYVTLNGYSRETGLNDKRCKIQVYNYETMELVKDLTPYGEYEYTVIEVSHDGKYLATLNENKTYLKVWDLETMELIINEPLFDDNNDDWCRAKDIYFSKIDENMIYLSGFFTKRISSKDIGDGTFKFSINDKTRELLLPDAIYASGNLIFLNQETIILNSTNQRIGILNLLTDSLDLYGYPPKNIFSGNIIYNKKLNYFIGATGNEISRFIYDGITEVNQNYEEEIIITPNPTASFVNINLECLEPQINYQINSSNGGLIQQSNIENQTGNIQIDFSPYPSGVYFLSITCGNELKSYKVVRE